MATVIASENFNSEEDATALRRALRDTKIDEQAIIDVLTKRSNDQRQLIRLTYKALFGKDLVADCRSTLSFNFKEVVLALLTKPRFYDADCMFDAIFGPGTNETTLIEILASRTNEEIQQINHIYSVIHKRTLSRDIEDDTSGYFRRFLVCLSSAKRETSPHINITKAKEDGVRLHEGVKTMHWDDEDAFLKIFGSQSFAQLRALFIIYFKNYEEDIRILIKKEFSGDIKRGFLAIVDAARSLPKFFARGLYKSMKGLGTDDKRLIRIIVSRSEIDMKEIKSEFRSQYKKSLESFIYGDTSGSYRKILLSLFSE